MSDEDDELGKRASDLSARALEQVLGEPVWVSKQNVVCKPIAYILTVSQQDAEGVIPTGKMRGVFTDNKGETKKHRQRKKNGQRELTSHWQDPVLLSWCENLC